MKIDLSEVVATLKHGEFDGARRKSNNIAFLLISCICFSLMIIFAIVFSLEQAKNPEPIETFVTTLVFTLLGLCLMTGIFLFLFFRNKRIEKEIIRCEEDAVEVYASTKKVGDSYDASNPLGELVYGPTLEKIQIDFKIEGKHFTKVSGKSGKLGTSDGFARIWTKYTGKPIRILYSRKFDQVILLKNVENK